MPVLEAETQKKYGYSPTALNPGSAKPVVYRCDTCGGQFERQRRHVIEPTLCHPCAIRRPQTQDVIRKRQRTMQSRYGVAHALQNPDILAKMQEGVRERHGVDNVSQTPEAREKKRNWWTKKYGVTEVPQGVLVEVGGPSDTQLYGKTCDQVADRVATWTGHSVIREKLLDGAKRIDIYVEAQRLGIEYCGLWWHREFVDRKGTTRNGPSHYRDRIRIAAQQGIRLVVIYENEWLERRSQVEARLKSILGVSSRRILARNCTVHELSQDDTVRFVGAYHIQPYKAVAQCSVGLFLDDELVGAMVFGPHHRQGNANVSVLQRLCFKADAYVVGGVEKLFTAARAQLKAQGAVSIRTWSDNRWSRGTVYERLGFTLQKVLPPDYAYVKPPNRLVPKQARKKSLTKCPAGVTEYEQARADGLWRIWDCGKRVWDFAL